MISIAGVKHTMSEVVHRIKTDPATEWKKSYPYYLLKINNSGSTNFATFPDLIMRLAGYVMAEPQDDQSALARYRGTGPVGRSALAVPAVRVNQIAQADRGPVAALMTTGQAGVGMADNGAHSTDPETGSPKGSGVSVTEYYVNGEAGRRVTKRTEGDKTTYYYSKSHAYNTYEYALLV